MCPISWANPNNFLPVSFCRYPRFLASRAWNLCNNTRRDKGGHRGKRRDHGGGGFMYSKWGHVVPVGGIFTVSSSLTFSMMFEFWFFLMHLLDSVILPDTICYFLFWCAGVLTGSCYSPAHLMLGECGAWFAWYSLCIFHFICIYWWWKLWNSIIWPRVWASKRIHKTNKNDPRDPITLSRATHSCAYHRC